MNKNHLASSLLVRARGGLGGLVGSPAFRCGNLSGSMRGTVRKISIPRRHIIDLMRASIGVPFVSLSRPLNVRPLLEARALAARPPGWAAIFVKAFALVAKEQPVLRTLYAKWPWPSFYELPPPAPTVPLPPVTAAHDYVPPQNAP